MASKCHHLKKIIFPDVGPKPIVDILIGVDYADLHCTEMEVKGESNRPVAQLTPLGWTCVGGINEPVLSTNFVTDNNQDLVSINNTIRKLWELEGDNHLDGHRALSPPDTEALKIVNKSLTHKEGKYKIRIPRKKDKQLDNNYSMALNHLANTEKRLLKTQSLERNIMRYCSILGKRIP